MNVCWRWQKFIVVYNALRLRAPGMWVSNRALSESCVSPDRECLRSIGLGLFAARSSIQPVR